jgi:hypothetical protein
MTPPSPIGIGVDPEPDTEPPNVDTEDRDGNLDVDATPVLGLVLVLLVLFTSISGIFWRICWIAVLPSVVIIYVCFLLLQNPPSVHLAPAL